MDEKLKDVSILLRVFRFIGGLSEWLGIEKLKTKNFSYFVSQISYLTRFLQQIDEVDGGELHFVDNFVDLGNEVVVAEVG